MILGGGGRCGVDVDCIFSMCHIFPQPPASAEKGVIGPWPTYSLVSTSFLMALPCADEASSVLVLSSYGSLAGVFYLRR